MAKYKMLKEPKAPKLPKRPKANASLSSKQAWLRKVEDLKQKHIAKLKAIRHENEGRKKANSESERLSQVIAGIGSIDVRSSSFTVRKKRKSYRHTAKKKSAKKKK